MGRRLTRTPDAANTALHSAGMTGGKHLEILAWYDNEWGFSNRLIDLALQMEQRGL
jgi:glyceraldehyde-3-phosphate dehydrogenase/erythrose-4-phosphate dehydrogenase